MRSLKKLIGILLCMSMLACSVVPALADDVVAESSTVCGKNALGLVNALSISDYGEDVLENEITRGEFYKMAAIAGGYGTAPVTAGRFSDVDAENEYGGYIESLVNAGVVSANAMGRIYPDGNITLQEASAVMIKILGYSLKADHLGGYPSGYKRVAMDLFLYDDLGGADDNTALTVGMGVQLIYNALDSTVMIYKSYGEDYKMEEGSSLAYSVFRVKHESNVLNAVDISRLSGENDVDSFHIQIGDLQLESREVENIYDYLGYHVDIFYRERKTEQYDKIVYMFKSDKNKETVIDIDDVVAVDGQRVKYDAENAKKSKTVSYASGVSVIYNGVATSQRFSMNLFKGMLGRIRLLDNDDSGSADVVFIDTYKNYAVSHVSGGDYLMYNMYDVSDSITLNTTADDPYTIIYNAEGKECKITEIKKGDIVSVYQSAADAYQQYIRAYISNKIVEGVITEIRDNKKYITLGGTVYKPTKECMAQDSALLEPGASVKLYLDIAGRIAKAEAGTDTKLSYAYVIAAKLDGTFEKSLALRLYTQDDKIAEYQTARKIILDGQTVKNSDAKTLTSLHDACVLQFGESVGTGTYSSVIRYALNSDGEVAVIDTVLNGKTNKKCLREDDTEANDALFMTSSTSNDSYRSSTGTIGPNVAVNAQNTKVMLYASPIDQDLMDDELYEILTANQVLVHNRKYAVNAFFTDRNKIVSDFVGVANASGLTGGLSTSDMFAVVDYLSKGIDDKGNIIDVITVLGNGMSVDVPVKKGFTFTASDSTSDPTIKSIMNVTELKKGDIIRYKTDNKGYLSDLELRYRTSNRTPVAAWATTFWSEFAYRRGFVYDVFDEGYMVYFTTNGDRSVLASKTSADCELVLNAGAYGPYFRYRVKENGESYVESTNKDALKSYLDTGADCSEIIIQQYYGTPMAVMMIEE